MHLQRPSLKQKNWEKYLGFGIIYEISAVKWTFLFNKCNLILQILVFRKHM